MMPSFALVEIFFIMIMKSSLRTIVQNSLFQGKSSTFSVQKRGFNMFSPDPNIINKLGFDAH